MISGKSSFCLQLYWKTNESCLEYFFKNERKFNNDVVQQAPRPVILCINTILKLECWDQYWSQYWTWCSLRLHIGSKVWLDSACLTPHGYVYFVTHFLQEIHFLPTIELKKSSCHRHCNFAVVMSNATSTATNVCTVCFRWRSAILIGNRLLLYIWSGGCVCLIVVFVPQQMAADFHQH